MDGGAAGILIAPDLQKVFAGTPNGLAIVDVDPGSSSYAQVVTISIGKGGSDELDYDPITRTVYFTDVGDQEIGVADAKMNTLMKGLHGNRRAAQIEQPRFNPADGMIYVAYRSTNSLAKYNPVTNTLVSVTKLAVPCTPSGVAIKPTTDMALLGCRAVSGPGLVYRNLASNALDHTIPNVTGVDGAIYNARADASSQRPPAGIAVR